MQYVLSKNAILNSSGTLNIQNTHFSLEIPFKYGSTNKVINGIYFNQVLQNDGLSNSATISLILDDFKQDATIDVLNKNSKNRKLMRRLWISKFY